MIKESPVMRIVWALIPVLIWLGLFFLSATPLWIGISTILNGHLAGGFFFMILGVFSSIIIVLLTKPLWYRNFFDKSFVGFDCTTMAQWDESRIHFSGPYFDLDVSKNDVLTYHIPFGIPDEKSMFAIRIKIKVENSIKTLWMPITMPDKINFLNFLENLKKT